MKKIIAILFLNVYLLSVCGPVVLREYLAYKSDNFFNSKAKDGLYNVDDLTEIKVPVNMPGVSAWSGFEKVSGRIQFADDAYNYVEMRVTPDAIYLKCIPNYETTRLSSLNVIHAENIKGMRIPKKEHVPYGKTTLTPGLSFAFARFEFQTPARSEIRITTQPVLKITGQTPDIPEQPPKGFC